MLKLRGDASGVVSGPTWPALHVADGAGGTEMTELGQGSLHCPSAHHRREQTCRGSTASVDVEPSPYRNGVEVPPSEDDQVADWLEKWIVKPVRSGGLARCRRHGRLE